MPPLNANDSEWQYTGMGWKKVDVDDEKRRLEELQEQLRVRREEIVNA